MVMMWSTEAHLGFIAPEINSEGIVLPDSKREKRNVGKGKVKQQRAVRQKFVFVMASKRGQKYRDYFNPDNTVQLRVMGMEDILVRTIIPIGHALLVMP
jgi:meiosis-specific protein